MAAAKSFQDLLVWQKAHQLVLDIYQLTKDLPQSELYGLTSQIRRAAVSVPANIAEGFIKQSNLEKKRFYNIAEGSLEEVRYYLILIRDLRMKETDNLQSSVEEVSKMLRAYKTKIGGNS